ncbi:MAG TPA: hypothetical protein VGU69_02625 [Rhizomicrobium sp.]|nr:hypothetical protein [Rhizomicrobium sp.]
MAFGHVITLLSFVFALTVVYLPRTVAEFIRNWDRVRLSLPHALWMLNALLAAIANWLSFYDLQSLKSWSAGTIVFMFTIAFANYLQAALVSPDIPATGPIDMRQFHEEQSRRYIGAALVTLLLALMANIVLGSAYNVREWSVQNLAVLPMAIVAAAALFLRQKWAQIALAIVMIGIWVVYFATLQVALH